MPDGVKLMSAPTSRRPNLHGDVRGVFHIGLGEQFDGDAVAAFPPGSVIVLPGNTWHFHWAKSGADITQIVAFGPLGLEYVEAADDPRTRALTPLRTAQTDTKV